MQHIMVVEFEDEGNLPRKLIDPSFQKPQWGSIGITSGINRELKVIVRILAGWVRRKTPRRPMLESLIHR